MMGNIYTAPNDYRIAPDVSYDPKTKGARIEPHYWVYNIPLNLRLAGFPTLDAAETFVYKRCAPERIASKCYTDICRCGGGGPAWDYVVVEELIFERCPRCKNPMRHDVMIKLNRPFLESFSLDDFLNL